MRGRRGTGEPYRILSVKIPINLWGKLMDYSYNHRKPMSEIVRAALSLYLQEQTQATPEPEETGEEETTTENYTVPGVSPEELKYIQQSSTTVLKHNLNLNLRPEIKEAIIQELRRRGEKIE